MWPTSEMQTRGEYRTLIYGAVIASAGGAILAVILLKNNICALTGVAVATTFMPPFVNAGLCFALATHLQISSVGQSYQTYTLGGEERSLKPAYAPPADYTVSYAYDMRVECLILAAISLAYTFVNIFFLGFFGFLVLKVGTLYLSISLTHFRFCFLSDKRNCPTKANLSNRTQILQRRYQSTKKNFSLIKIFQNS